MKSAAPSESPAPMANGFWVVLNEANRTLLCVFVDWVVDPQPVLRVIEARINVLRRALHREGMVVVLLIPGGLSTSTYGVHGHL